MPNRTRTYLAAALTVVCALPVVAVPAAHAADGSGTVAGLVTVPRPGGFYGSISFFRQDGDGDAAADATVTTTDGGHYLATLPTGTYKVGFSTETTDDFGTAYFDDVDSLDAATPVDVRDGAPTEHVDADLVIDPAKGQVAGRIAASGGGVYTGDVEFYRVDGDSITSAGSAFAYLGDYDKVLAPGTYTFGFGLDADDPYLPRYYPNSAELDDATTFDVGAGSVVTADTTATADPGQGVISGAVTTPDGPFTGDATFIWQGPDPASHPTLTTYVDAGSYSRTLRAGTYLVGFSIGTDHDGYLDQYFDGKPTQAGATLVDVGAGEQVAGIDGDLDADLGDGHMAGVVTLSDGSGYDGTVSFFRQDGDGDAVADFTTDVVDGEFDRALPPGDYKVGFDVNGTDDFQAAYYDGVTSLGAATPVTVTAGVTTDQIDAVLVPAPHAPDRPDAPTVTRGDRSATVTWTAPDDGGSPIQTYTIKSVPTGFEQTLPGTATHTTITGLTNGTGYRFTVTATNDVADSPTSRPSALAVPAGAPAAPGAPTVTRGDHSATVTWTAPDDGGSPIQTYTIKSVPTGFEQTLPGTATHTTITGLTNGTGYRFTVTATNDVADSPTSRPSALAVPAGAPGRVGRPTVRVRGKAARLSWPAASPNGAPVTSYVVTSTRGARQVRAITQARRLTIRHLRPGRYTVRIFARNAVGSSLGRAVTVKVKVRRH